MTIWDVKQRARWQASWVHKNEQAETPAPGSHNAAVWAAQDHVNAEHVATLARIEELTRMSVDAFYHGTAWTDDNEHELRQLCEIMAAAHLAASEGIVAKQAQP